MAMDWANEWWVRLYTRDTTTWKLLDFDARAVLMLMLRKVDRSGVIDVGDDGIEGLAALIDAPIDRLEAAMPKLMRRGSVIGTGTAYVLPNFVDAQETPSSDKQRQRVSRASRRDRAIDASEKDGFVYVVAAGDGSIKVGFAVDVESRLRNLRTTRPDGVTLLSSWQATPADERRIHGWLLPLRIAGEWYRDDGLSEWAEANQSRPVTDVQRPSILGHAVSRTVTDGHSEREKKDQTEEQETEPALPAPLSLLGLGIESDPPTKPDPVADLWAIQERLRAESIPGCRPLKLTDDRRRLVRDARKLGYSDDDLRAALVQCATETKLKPENARWFNGETNWRPKSIAFRLGSIGAAPDGPPRSGHVATTFRRPTDEELAR